DGLPMLPVAPPSPDYIPGVEEPQTPPAPQDEDKHEPMFIHPHDLDFEDEDEDEEHLALADSAIVLPTDEHVSPPEGTEPIIPPPSTDITTTRARITVQLQAAISLPLESSTARPTGGRGIDYGFVSTLDAEASRRGIAEVRFGIRDTWIDPAETVPEIAPMIVGEVNPRVTELTELYEHDTQDLYALLEDAQDRLSQAVYSELQTHQEQVYAYEF
nr:hypothetical protein [Tanacetum cinerariifolium]